MTTRHGIPVTTVPRAIFDLAGTLGALAVEQSLRQAERQRLFDVLSLEDLLARHPRHRGNKIVRECLRHLRESPGGVTREELEARFLAFLGDRRMPRPHLNAWLTIGSNRYEVDCLWPAQRMIVELDGYATHGTRGAFESDRERDRKLTVAGFRSIRVTWRQLHDDPEAVAADLRRLLARPPNG